MSIRLITKQSILESSTAYRIDKIAGQHFSIVQDVTGFNFTPLNTAIYEDDDYIRIPGINFLQYDSITIVVTSVYLEDAKKLAELIQNVLPTINITVYEK